MNTQVRRFWQLPGKPDLNLELHSEFYPSAMCKVQSAKIEEEK